MVLIFYHSIINNYIKQTFTHMLMILLVLCNKMLMEQSCALWYFNLLKIYLRVIFPLLFPPSHLESF